MKTELVVHSSYEAGLKKGGIGATLFGLISLDKYHEDVERTILLGPFSRDNPIEFKHVKENVEINYLSEDGICKVDNDIKLKLESIEKRYNVEILYGKRKFKKHSVEIILVDGKYHNIDRLNLFKAKLYDNFGFSSHFFEDDDEFNECMSIAIPSLRAVYVLTDLKNINNKLLITHDVHALPTLYASKLMEMNYKNLFFLHEVPCSRDTVECLSGHDILFYNMVKFGHSKDRPTMCYSECEKCFRYDILKGISEADTILSVGDFLESELNYFYKTENFNVKKVYRGIPHFSLSLGEKMRSREKVIEYTSSILGFRPDYIFTHITRLLHSKAIWRDLQVLKDLDDYLYKNQKRGIHIILSSVIPEGRNVDDIKKMEREYGWPVIHKEGYPDLVSHEINCYNKVKEFNRSTKAIRSILINQFGWSREKCGVAVSEDMTFKDIRVATDVEFGLSIYEPFGVSNLETVTSGGICILSTSCGSLNLLRDKIGDIENNPNIIIADYIGEGKSYPREKLCSLKSDKYLEIEKKLSKKIANELSQKLPVLSNDYMNKLIDGQKMAEKLSWNKIYDEKYRTIFFE